MGINGSLLEHLHAVKGLDPVADAFSGTVDSDVVKMDAHRRALFVVHKGVGVTGTATITAHSCDNANGDNPVAIPFRYRAVTTGDTPGALTEATASGFTTSAGSSQLYLVEVDAVEAGKNDDAWIFLRSTEVVDSPVIGSILALLTDRTHVTDESTVIA